MSRRDDLRVEFAKAIVAGLYADPTVTEIDTVKICDEAERMADEITRRETAGAEARKQAEDAEIAKLCNTIEAKNAEIDIRDAEIRILRAQRAAAKPDTRYPWDEAPEWAICAATDSDGWEGWYEVTPKPGEVIFGKGVGKVSVMHRDTPDWRDSLEYRPGYKPEEADK